jgi:hypothetical protein
MIMHRRDFFKRAAQITTGMAAASASPVLFTRCDRTVKDIDAVIPMPIQVVIDDVGWWSGRDGNAVQEPYRTGINRNHVPADYQAIVDLGRSLGIRPQAAMVLCEWDRENILKQLPTSTWMGKDWDNKKWVGPWLDEAADIMTSNELHFEMTMHGIGHEYWTDGTFTRAEWADKSGTMRPLDQVEAHLDYFGALMKQNNLGSFPSSFVPTAFCHGFGPTGDHDLSIAEVLSKRGMTYINTPFYNMYNAEAVSFRYFGFDAGVITVDRGHDLLSWKSISTPPHGELQGPTCGLHWPNVLHEDPGRNGEIVEAWAKFLKPYDERLETLLAPNSLSFRHQIVHFVCTRLSLTENKIKLDFSEVETLPGTLGRGQVALKLKSASRLKFADGSLEIISEDFARAGNGYLYTLVLNRKTGQNIAFIDYSRSS